MTLEDFIDLGAKLELKALELTAYYFPKTTPEYLKSVKGRCDKHGIAVSGTAVGNDFCDPDKKKQAAQLDAVKAWVDRSAALGAKTMRIFAGTLRKGDTEEEARKRAVDLIQRACDHAAKAKVFLALENHGGITATADQFLAIVKAVEARLVRRQPRHGQLPHAGPLRRPGEGRPLRRRRADQDGGLPRATSARPPT